jgi:hypothetical protein
MIGGLLPGRSGLVVLLPALALSLFGWLFGFFRTLCASASPRSLIVVQQFLGVVKAGKMP